MTAHSRLTVSFTIVRKAFSSLDKAKEGCGIRRQLVVRVYDAA